MDWLVLLSLATPGKNEGFSMQGNIILVEKQILKFWSKDLKFRGFSYRCKSY